MQAPFQSHARGGRGPLGNSPGIFVVYGILPHLVLILEAHTYVQHCLSLGERPNEGMTDSKK